jgi:tetratricopeptide (TPR) repeat protein
MTAAAPRLGILLSVAIAMNVAAGPTLPDFSAQLDAQWDYASPPSSEARFRAELERWPADDPRALIVTTQIARTQSLRRQFAAAHATLDLVQPKLDGMPSHVRVRYLLERGRTFNSAGMPERAMPLFAEALALAECGDDAFYAIDAAHMLGIAAPPPERLDYDLKALSMAESATDARARRWRAPLYNNIGYAHQERGDFATALAWYRKALPAYEERGDPRNVRIARWMIARALRALGELDEAEAIQRRLLVEWERAGESDGYVYEELAEIAVARGRPAAAKPWAAKAHAALAADAGFAAEHPERLARLEAIAAGNVPPPSGARSR